ncbi:MAG: hypothetical protein WB239_04050 [Acidimicrobiia bacterium]
MDSYSGAARILDSNGILLTVGSVDLESKPETRSWGGLLRVIAHTGVAGKALHVKLDLGQGRIGDAALDPLSQEDGVAFSEVAGIGPQPF